MGDHKGRPYTAFVADIEWRQAVLFHVTLLSPIMH